MNALWVGIVILGVIVLVAKVGLGGSGANSAAAKEKIKQGAMVLDVRTPAEYESGHYQDAKNIPLQDLQNRLDQLGDKKKAIVVYCASGMRSAKAANILTAAGFMDVTDAGGLSNLGQSGSRAR
ncbi:MAG: rhodanese-like domain-containing protein [bacterium]